MSTPSPAPARSSHVDPGPAHDPAPGTLLPIQSMYTESCQKRLIPIVRLHTTERMTFRGSFLFAKGASEQGRHTPGCTTSFIPVDVGALRRFGRTLSDRRPTGCPVRVRVYRLRSWTTSPAGSGVRIPGPPSSGWRETVVQRLGVRLHPDTETPDFLITLINVLLLITVFPCV